MRRRLAIGKLNGKEKRSLSGSNEMEKQNKEGILIYHI